MPKQERGVERELVSAQMNWIVESGLSTMMATDSLADLALMYRLLSRVRGGLDLMRSHLAEYIESTGKELVSNDTVKTKLSLFSLLQFLSKNRKK